jgi:hypothetical protein
MRATKIAPIAAAATAAVLLLAGCSDDSTDGSAEPAAKSGGDTEQVDPASLDTGAFPTAPRPEFTSVGDAFLGRSVEGQRMAEFVVLPPELDPQLTEGAPMSTYVIKDGNSLGIILPDPTEKVAADNGMLVGFSTSRSTEGRGPEEKSLVHAVLRFPDAAAAKKAATEMHQSVLAYDSGTGLPQPGTINNFPDILATKSEANGAFSTNGFTPHNEYVIYTWAKAPAAEKDWAAKILAKASTDQGAMIDKFPATAPDQYKNLKVDVDNVLRATIPTEGKQTTSSGAVYGPRGAAHFSTDALDTLDTFKETGTTRQAQDATNVYLSENEQGANDLMSAFGQEVATVGGMTPAAAPANVPNSACWSKQTSQGVENYCLVQKGTHLAEIYELDAEQKAHQMAAAQYLIFTAAN